MWQTLSDSDSAAHLLATKIKRQQLKDCYPDISATLLDVMFRDNGLVSLMIVLHCVPKNVHRAVGYYFVKS